MVGWHHQLDGHEFEQAPGVGDGWRPSVLRSMGVTESRTRLSNCTDWLAALEMCILYPVSCATDNGLINSEAREKGNNCPLVIRFPKIGFEWK